MPTSAANKSARRCCFACRPSWLATPSKKGESEASCCTPPPKSCSAAWKSLGDGQQGFVLEQLDAGFSLANQPSVPAGDEDLGRSATAVVVARHAHAVGTGRQHRHEVTG